MCIINACKLISGMVKKNNNNEGPGADDFLPCLIYCVFKADILNAISNIIFI